MNKPFVFVFVFIVAGALCACGPTAVDRARNTEHRLRRDRLWSEIVDVLRERHPNARIAAMEADRLQTEWFYISKVHVAGTKHTYRPAYLQITVNVRGENPYRVAVRVHGAMDDIDGTLRWATAEHGHLWVAPTERKLTMAIHERLAGTRDAR